ncbi:unnamed protein product [Protopolystoma xenopodis]|uniref:Uncharacterized protein n=1 Tax=Protopolystoma xenopodis TaxID=117903 RepID=A0A448XC59_9PLAT|nr:unnamed protein product [Protopolystoma xenopodis]
MRIAEADHKVESLTKIFDVYRRRRWLLQRVIKLDRNRGSSRRTIDANRGWK